ncbi:MAG TPA: ROK family protein, partial [Acidimicrobiia bacterium]|nr:ROK family protein [Acidimicrobiia bacterium]
ARGDAPALLARAGGIVEAITGHEAGQSALAGEADGLAILAEHGAAVALGLGGLVNILDPELVVIGGGLVHLGEALLGPIRRELPARVEAASLRPMPPVVAAALGEQAGAVGAAALARTLVTAS